MLSGTGSDYGTRKSILSDMARRKPLNPEDFLKVNGVGDKKHEEYGALFLAAIKEYSRGT